MDSDIINQLFFKYYIVISQGIVEHLIHCYPAAIGNLHLSAASLKAKGKARQQKSSYHVVARFYILSDPMADQWWLRGTVYKRHKLVLVIFWKVFIFNLKKREGFSSFQLMTYRKHIATALMSS